MTYNQSLIREESPVLISFDDKSVVIYMQIIVPCCTLYILCTYCKMSFYVMNVRFVPPFPGFSSVESLKLSAVLHFHDKLENADVLLECDFWAPRADAVGRFGSWSKHCMATP